MCALAMFYLSLLTIGGLHFWLRAFLLLLACSILIWIGVKSARRKSAKGLGIVPSISNTSATAKRVIAGISLFAAGAVFGYIFRGDMENRARYTYTDVLVMARNDAQNYDLRPARMEAFQAGLCAPNDWQQWQKMKVFTFRVNNLPDGKTCLDAFEGGYEFYTLNGKRLLFPQENLTDARY